MEGTQWLHRHHFPQQSQRFQQIYRCGKGRREASIYLLTHDRTQVALYEAPASMRHYPHATRTSGPCAVGLPQFKAAGLVQVSDLHLPLNT